MRAERDYFTPKFTRWWKYNKIYKSIELKATKDKSLSFKKLKVHQFNKLKYGFGYKIPDVGMDQKPTDFVGCAPGGLVAVMFYTRGCKKFYLIHIDDWEYTEKNCGRKSLTEPMAEDIAYKIGKLQ